MNIIALNRFKYIVLLSLLVGITVSCGGKKRERQVASKPQPLLDSTYYINYFNQNPGLREQTDWVKKFYRERKFSLAWFRDNKLVPQAGEMLDRIKQSDEEGLDPRKYQFVDFKRLFDDLEAAKRDSARFTGLQKEIDVALSATYFVWASDYYRGVVVPRENEEIEWDVKRNKIKLHKALMTVLGERKSKYSYATFSPLHPDYGRLKSALATYRKIREKGGWPIIPSGLKLKVGQASSAIPLLRQRLGLSGTDSIYSTEIASAVKKFQIEHGLKADGNLGTETVRQMNVSIDDRIRQIIINMERWRWIPKSFEPDYLLVNIPEYKLYITEKGKRVMSMNVIVGKEMNSTPIFSDKMEHVVLSPYWNVPVNIIRKEIAPQVARNPGYLDRLDMEVINSSGEQVSASSVNWSSITPDNWKYTLRRRPGPKNDLGDVKFMFPNTNNIYLHDTPHDELFSQAKRGFSHGCIRVEKPVELAEYLLKPVGWDRSRIESAIAERKEKYVKLKTVLPVYLVYFTAWVDDQGRAHFRDDIYGHDATLEQKYFSRVKVALSGPSGRLENL